MRQTVIFALLAAIVFFVAPAGVSSAFSETIVVQDDVIFIGDDANMPCASIPLDLRPALVFVEEQATEQRLYTACFHGGGTVRQLIATAEYLQVTQLSDTIFLVGTTGGSTDRGVFVLDLDRGVGKQIARSTRIHCLRSVPEQGKAMLIHCHAGIGEVRYLELDLATLSLTLCHTFKQSNLGDKYGDIGPGTALSPDFQQVADMVADSFPASQCRLTLMDLTTLEQRVLDDNVSIAFSSISSDLSGRPPLDWIDAGQIVYRHIPLDEPNNPNLLLEAPCVFKCADANTGAISEILQQTLRLGVGAGSLKLNPLNGELLYNGQSVLDPNEGTLTSAILPYSIVNEYSPAHAEVFIGEDLLHTTDGTIVSTLVSPRHLHFAYVVRVLDEQAGSTLHVKIADIAGHTEVTKGYGATAPAGWIE